ncbi:MAG: DUF3800 domain-containing protein [Saprospiraceae bacterium]
MNFEVYCDESSLEALTNKSAHRYAAIGGVWIPSTFRQQLKKDILFIKGKYSVRGELKWSKLSPIYLPLYKEIVQYFFQTDQIRFRVILIESMNVDHYRFNHNNPELGFYKFYYQLLHHWIFDYNNYNIYLDLKVNRNKGRLKELERILDNSNLTSDILQVQGLPSEESIGIQVADVLTGLVATKFNAEATGRSKLDLIKYVEEDFLKGIIAPTPKWEEKFNVFKIDLKGGW